MCVSLYTMLHQCLPNSHCAGGGTVYRVNWLRAKCRSDRWAEELILAKSEMQWTKLYHQRRAEAWSARAKSVALLDPELRYYARRQARTWSLLHSHIENAIADTLKHL